MAAISLQRVPALLGVPLLLAGIQLATVSTEFVDDAYISFRYAANLARFGEFTFNRGERLEGITNLLWTAWLALASAATGLDLPRLAQATSIVSYVAAIAVTYGALVSMSGSVVVAGLAMFVAVGSIDVFRAAMNGLEGPLFALLIAVAFALADSRRGVAAGIACGLLFATRPEGIVVGALLILSAAAGGADRRFLLRAAASAAAVAAAITCFRLAYFGSPIPNSIIAKSIPLEFWLRTMKGVALRYVLDFMAADPTKLAVALTGALMLGASLVDRLRSEGSPLAPATPTADQDRWLGARLFALTTIAFSIAVTLRNAGDWMPSFRLLNQYFPVYAILAASLATHRPLGGAVLKALAGLALITMTIGLVNGARIAPQIVDNQAWSTTAIARLDGLLRPEDRIAVEAAGMIPYRLLDHRFHDPLGLLDRHIARNGETVPTYGRLDAHYTLAVVRPEFGIWHSSGFFGKVAAEVLEDYVAYCHERCDKRTGAALILVRRDRHDARVAASFADWTPWPLASAPAPR